MKEIKAIIEPLKRPTPSNRQNRVLRTLKDRPLVGTAGFGLKKRPKPGYDCIGERIAFLKNSS